MFRRGHRNLGASIGFLFAVILLPAGAFAHGGLQPLETWGGFGGTAAYCQRIIGDAAANCALRTARLRSQCLDARSRGLPCDENTTNAAIVAVRREILDLVSLHCEEQDAIAIGYLSASFDLSADIIRFCREWEITASSAAYAPILAPAALDAEDRACVDTTVAMIAKLAQLTFDSWRATMDRLATRAFDLETKTAAIDRGSARTAAMQPGAAGALQEKCGAVRFESLYQRTPAQLIAEVAARAHCFPSSFYLQDKLTCAAAVCGNWIVEPMESCDDGNTAAGDGCDSECQDEDG